MSYALIKSYETQIINCSLLTAYGAPLKYAFPHLGCAHLARRDAQVG